MTGLLQRLKRTESERQNEGVKSELADTQGQVVGTIMQEYLDTKVRPRLQARDAASRLEHLSASGCAGAFQGFKLGMQQAGSSIYQPVAALVHYKASSSGCSKQARAFISQWLRWCIPRLQARDAASRLEHSSASGCAGAFQGFKLGMQQAGSSIYQPAAAFVQRGTQQHTAQHCRGAACCHSCVRRGGWARDCAVRGCAVAVQCMLGAFDGGSEAGGSVYSEQ